MESNPWITSTGMPSSGHPFSTLNPEAPVFVLGRSTTTREQPVVIPPPFSTHQSQSTPTDNQVNFAVTEQPVVIPSPFSTHQTTPTDNHVNFAVTEQPVVIPSPFSTHQTAPTDIQVNFIVTQQDNLPNVNLIFPEQLPPHTYDSASNTYSNRPFPQPYPNDLNSQGNEWDNYPSQGVELEQAEAFSSERVIQHPDRQNSTTPWQKDSYRQPYYDRRFPSRGSFRGHRGSGRGNYRESSQRQSDYHEESGSTNFKRFEHEQFHPSDYDQGERRPYGQEKYSGKRGSHWKDRPDANKPREEFRNYHGKWNREHSNQDKYNEGRDNFGKIDQTGRPDANKPREEFRNYHHGKWNREHSNQDKYNEGRDNFSQQSDNWRNKEDQTAPNENNYGSCNSTDDANIHRASSKDTRRGAGYFQKRGVYGDQRRHNRRGQGQWHTRAYSHNVPKQGANNSPENDLEDESNKDDNHAIEGGVCKQDQSSSQSHSVKPRKGVYQDHGPRFQGSTNGDGQSKWTSRNCKHDAPKQDNNWEVSDYYESRQDNQRPPKEDDSVQASNNDLDEMKHVKTHPTSWADELEESQNEIKEENPDGITLMDKLRDMEIRQRSKQLSINVVVAPVQDAAQENKKDRKPRRSIDFPKLADPRMEREKLNKSDSMTASNEQSTGGYYKSRRSEGSYNNKLSEFDSSQEFRDKEFGLWEKHWGELTDFKIVQEIQDDLFDQPKEYSLAHCVAEDLRMGSGIAVFFKREFKSLADLLDQKAKQGGLAILPDEQNSRFIYYLVTKRESYGKPTYYTLWKSLDKMRTHIKENQVKKLAIPRLGCGLDKLDWDKVKSMIEHLFKDMDMEIKVCNYQQNESIEDKKSKCKLVIEEFPITKIDTGTLLLYFASSEGEQDDNMQLLSKKFNFLPEFNQKKPKTLGDIVYHDDKVQNFGVCGCIVRATNRDEISFKSLHKCIQNINKMNKQFGSDAFEYVAFQWVDQGAYADDLINQKIITMLINFLRNVNVYVCRGSVKDEDEAVAD